MLSIRPSGHIHLLNVGLISKTLVLLFLTLFMLFVMEPCTLSLLLVTLSLHLDHLVILLLGIFSFSRVELFASLNLVLSHAIRLDYVTFYPSLLFYFILFYIILIIIILILSFLFFFFFFFFSLPWLVLPRGSLLLDLTFTL